MLLQQSDLKQIRHRLAGQCSGSRGAWGNQLLI